MHERLRTLCVFCGSRQGTSPIYREAAQAFGAAAARRGLTLVTGGGHVGLMGVVADAALAAGGQVHGVIPERLEGRELAHRGLTSLEVTADMHTRKARMYGLADAFVALPGGFGTLDELFESLTWAQLGLHAKPVGLLDTGGYYAGLRIQLAQAIEAGFCDPGHLALLHVAAAPDALLDLVVPPSL